jgi:carbamate kinase
LDVLGAQTEGMIGYMIEQELGNLLPFEVPFATILTMVEVDSNDPAFQDPTMYDPNKERTLMGVEAVIDKDRAGELLGARIGG